MRIVCMYVLCELYEWSMMMISFVCSSGCIGACMYVFVCVCMWTMRRGSECTHGYAKVCKFCCKRKAKNGRIRAQGPKYNTYTRCANGLETFYTSVTHFFEGAWGGVRACTQIKRYRQTQAKTRPKAV